MMLGILVLILIAFSPVSYQYGMEDVYPNFMRKIYELGFGIEAVGQYGGMTVGDYLMPPAANTDDLRPGARLWQTIIYEKDIDSEGFHMYGGLGYDSRSKLRTLNDLWYFGFDVDIGEGGAPRWYWRWGNNDGIYGNGESHMTRTFWKNSFGTWYSCNLRFDYSEDIFTVMDSFKDPPTPVVVDCANQAAYSYNSLVKMGARYGAAAFYVNYAKDSAVTINDIMYFGGVGFPIETKDGGVKLVNYVNNEAWRMHYGASAVEGTQGILYTCHEIWVTGPYSLSPVAPRYGTYSGFECVAPGARAFMNAHKVFDPYAAVIFGGYYDPRTSYADVWVLEFNRVTTGSGAEPITWDNSTRSDEESDISCQRSVWNDSLSVEEQHPESRYGYMSWMYPYNSGNKAARVGNKLWIFGGTNNCIGVYLGDIWTLDSSYIWERKSIGTRAYSSPAKYGKDSPGMFDSSNYIGNRMMGGVFQWEHTRSGEEQTFFGFFGGFGFAKNGAGFLNDVWLYRVEDDTWGYMTPFIHVNNGGNTTEWISGRYGTVSVDRGDGTLLLMNGQTYKDGKIRLIGDMWELSFKNDDLEVCAGETTLSVDQCGGKGLCYADNSCICSEYFDGNLCQFEKYTCNGTIYSKDYVCNSIGVCLDFDDCDCTPGDSGALDQFYMGQFCEEKYGKLFEVLQPNENETYVKMEIAFYTKHSFVARHHGGKAWSEIVDVRFNCSLAVKNFEILGNDSNCTWKSSGSYETLGLTDTLVVETTRNWALFDLEEKKTDPITGEDEWISDSNYIYLYAQGNTLDKTTDGTPFLNETAVLRVYWFVGNISSNKGKTIIIDNTEETKEETKETNTQGGEYVIIGTVSVVAIVGLIMACFLCYCCYCFVCLCWCSCIPLTITLYKASQLNHIKLLQLEQEMNKGEEFDNMLFGEDLFNVAWEDIVLKEIISQGSTATIYKVKHAGRTAALKCFKTKDIATQDHMDDFEKEVKMLRKLQHDNILVYYGASRKPPRMGIVEEYCPNGDLRYAIQEGYVKRMKDEARMSLRTKLRILKEVACAMSHLNSMSIIHRDLKSDNVLLTKDFKAKLIDFGLSRVMEGATTMYLTKQAGTSQYMAPEVTLSSQYGEKCDVYSYGIMLFEVLTENFTPYFVDGMPPEFNVELRVALNPDFRPPIDNYPHPLAPALNWYISLMKHCWDVNVDKRPDFTEIEKIMEEHTPACLESWEANEGKQRETVILCMLGDLLQDEMKEAIEKHDFPNVELTWVPEVDRADKKVEVEDEGEEDLDQMFEDMDFDI